MTNRILLAAEFELKRDLKILEQFEGTVKYPDFPIDKYDVYKQ